MTTLLSRRAFNAGLCGCGASFLAACTTTDQFSKPAVPGQKLQAEVPAGYRPNLSTDEGGLWATVEKAEEQLKNSRFLVRDPLLNAYVQELVGELAGEFRNDVRVYIVRTPVFNANMAPNGKMEVFSGMLLRAQNEAQLAAVLGHELGHYFRRHTLQLWRDARAKQDFMVFASMGLSVAGLGAVASVANVAVLASIYGYGREHEREADTYGIQMLVERGYDPYQAAAIWQQLIEESDARENKQTPSLMFASHPAPAERVNNLTEQAQASGVAPGRRRGDARFAAAIASARPWMLRDEVRLRTPGPTLVLFDRMLKADPADAEVLFARGEVRRLRGKDNDFDIALADYAAATATGRAPAVTYRSIGFLLQRRQDYPGAVQAFGKYIDAEPGAEDKDVIIAMINNGGRP